MGRIDYISNPKRQEYLYCTYATAEPRFWEELAAQNQFEFQRYQRKGTCIEARELVITLPESFVELDPEKLLMAFTEKFRQEYGMQCTSALHHNKTKTNYHIHLIYSERPVLEKKIKKVATRNMFYNEKDQHVRTKKEILDENGEIRKGCYIIPKGEIYEMSYFGPKDSRFKRRGYLDEVRKFYTGLMNRVLEMQGVPESERMQVFDPNGPYLATKKIGKNNPKDAVIKADNEVRKQWNSEVDAALVAGVPEEELIEFRKEEITDKIHRSIQKNGNRPELLSNILVEAVSLLRSLVTKIYKTMKQDYLSNRNGVDARHQRNSDNIIFKYEQLKPMYSKLWEYTRKKRWNETRRDALKNALEELPKESSILAERINIQKQIRRKESKISEYELKLNATALSYGFQTVREATNAYWRTKEEVENLGASKVKENPSEPKLPKQKRSTKEQTKRPSILRQLREKQKKVEQHQVHNVSKYRPNLER